MSAVAQRRALAAVLPSQEAPVGTFTVRRALPARERRAIGPWVFLDHFGPFTARDGDGVGAHPHAGIETVTYLLSGRQEHRDSQGNVGIVGAGGAQWMTAGRGIVHAEFPRPLAPADREVHGIQLWTSLPRRMKAMEPRYRNLPAESIAVANAPGAIVRVIGGTLAGATGPGEALMPLVLAHVTLEPGASFEARVPADFEMGAYVVRGEAEVAGTRVAAGALAAWDAGEGAVAFANPGAEPLEAMVLGGAPAEGPLVFHGPFVMNSVEQVRAAEVAYRTGRMGTVQAP